MWSLPEEAELVNRALVGEGLALDLLLCRYAVRLKRHLEPKMPALLNGIVDVDDILQQTFLQIFRDIKRFQPQGQGSFYAWMRGIAENRMFDCVREHKRKKRGGEFHRKVTTGDPNRSDVLLAVDLLAGQGGTPSQSFARHELIDGIRERVDALPAEQREAIRYHCLEGRSLEETALLMRKTSGAVRALVHRGKLKLKQQIDESSM